MSKINIVLDSTMLDTFSMCEQKYDYRFNKNKVVPEKPKPLDRGGIIHIGEESYYNDLKNNIEFNQRLEHAKQRMNEEWMKDSDLSPAEISRILEVYPENKIFWRERDERLEILAVEQAFSYILHEDDTIRIVMIGKIDLLVNEPGYTRVPYDHKTYERSYPVRRLMNQFCNYVVATDSYYLFVNKIGFQTSLKSVDKHKRIPLSYDPLILDQWKKNTILLAYKYLECNVSGEWPMNLTSCDKFNRECEYYGVCDSSGIEAKTYKLEANFNTSEPWDVSKSLGKKND